MDQNVISPRDKTPDSGPPAPDTKPIPYCFAVFYLVAVEQNTQRTQATAVNFLLSGNAPDPVPRKHASDENVIPELVCNQYARGKRKIAAYRVNRYLDMPIKARIAALEKVRFLDVNCVVIALENLLKHGITDIKTEKTRDLLASISREQPLVFLEKMLTLAIESNQKVTITPELKQRLMELRKTQEELSFVEQKAREEAWHEFDKAFDEIKKGIDQLTRNYRKGLYRATCATIYLIMIGCLIYFLIRSWIG